MAYGGKRKGAGRRSGPFGKLDVELQELIDKQNDLSPGRVLLDRMWHHYYEAQRLRQDPTIANNSEGKRRISKSFMKAAIAAKRAAPYIHSKLARCHVDEHDLDENLHDAAAENSAPRPRVYTQEELRKMDSETLAKVYREEIENAERRGEEGSEAKPGTPLDSELAREDEDR